MRTLCHATFNNEIIMCKKIISLENPGIRCMEELMKKRVCIRQVELNDCPKGAECPFVHEYSHIEVFELYT